MARVKTSGSPRPLLPVRESDGIGEIIVEIGGEGTTLVDAKKPERVARGEQDITLTGMVTEVLSGTPTTDVFGRDTVGMNFYDYVWINKESSKLHDLITAAGIADDDGEWDSDDLHGVSVGVRYNHRTREGDPEPRVNVVRYFEVPA